MNRYTICILGAGCLWGFMGLFTRQLGALGFDSPGTLIVRCGLACILFGITLLIKDRRLLRIRLRHLWCFLGVGICSLLFFTYCYFQCIRLTSLSMAAVLLYTAPSMVMLISLAVFREKLTARKVLALILAFLGCCLVSGIGAERFDLTGVILGLCSGLGYALYSIFARLALNRGYDSQTINFYAMLFGTVGACVIWGGWQPVQLAFSSWESLGWSVATGVFSCYLPYLLYTYGLTGTETGKASVMASTEPVVATLLGIFAYHEALTLASAAGVVLVLAAIVVLNLHGPVHRKDTSPQHG